MADPSLKPAPTVSGAPQSVASVAQPRPPSAPPPPPLPSAHPSMPQSAPMNANLKQTLPMVLTKQTMPMIARPNLNAPIDRALQAQVQAPVSTQRERVDKLVRLVTVLLALLAVACVAIGLMLYFLVVKT